MKRSQVFAVFVLALLLLTAVPLQQARAQGSYSEKLTVYISGSDALWFMRFDGINGSARLSSLESTPGLSWYNITAIKTTGWQSDFQAFGKQGYDLLPVPFLPSEGLFLSVGSDSFADASATAGAVGSYLLTSFASWSNGTGTYSFYSPLSFTEIVPKTLLSFLPSTAAGFAAAISASAFDSTSSPMVTLNGVRSSSGFAHSLVVGSMTNKGLDAQKRPNFLAYFGSAVTLLRASNASTSSTIQVRVLDGILKTKDSAVISDNTSPYSGSYVLTLSPGKAVRALNATILQQPVPLLAYRTIESGVVRTGANITVTVTLTVLTQAGQARGINFTDDWWRASGAFKLVRGNATFPSIIPGGATVTPVYVLQYIGSTPGRITMPPSVIRYGFPIGNSTFEGQTALNPVPLSLGTDDAVVFAYTTPSGGIGKPVGAMQNMTVIAKNVGTVAANSVTVAGKQVPGLADHGGQVSVNASLAAQGLLGFNQTRTYSVAYTNGNGVSYNSTTNLVQGVFSHTSMKVGFPSLVITESLVPKQNGIVNLTLTFTTSNTGAAGISMFMARGSLPRGLACGVANGTGISCSGGVVSLNYTSLAASGSDRAYLRFNLTSPSNFFLQPFSYQTVSSGINLTGWSGGVGIPAGLALAKSFSPAQFFAGMASAVSIVATNSGPLTIYNATISSGADSFDTLGAAANTSKTTNAIAPGGTVSLTYGVTASSTTNGDIQSSAILARFFFQGTSFTVSGQGPKVSIYTPLSASVTTSPALPTEGKNLLVRVSITNPSAVNVTNVLFSLPIPPGLSLSQLQNASVSGGVLTVAFSSMAAHQTLNATAMGVASSGLAVPVDGATLRFNYAGVSVKGKLVGQGIAIGEDVTTRYLLPTGIVFLALLAAAFYVRRKTFTTAPSSQK
ncbi:MAG: hypothetical protein OK404_02260 [Thaumarchaeota archaeon]|nr:hypothetical protein [Nitrososphaerota archaeon]